MHFNHDISETSDYKCLEVIILTLGRWSDWSPDGECSASCGSGMQRETRECLGGTPGLPECIGPIERMQLCNTDACPAEWGPFGAYGNCSATCGGGEQSRTRYYY